MNDKTIENAPEQNESSEERPRLTVEVPTELQAGLAKVGSTCQCGPGGNCCH